MRAGLLAATCLAILLASPAGTSAQDASQALIRERLAEQGLSDVEIERLLTARTDGGGFADADTTGATDLADPARAILDAAESAGAAEAGTPARSAPEIPERAREARQPPARDPDAPVPAESLPRFGADLFALSPELFEPAAYGAIDPGYPLGPGDEIVVDVWGDSVFRVVRTIDRQGNVLLGDVGQVNLSGLTVEQANRRLQDRGSRVYSGLAADPPTTFLEVSLGKLRPIRVFVVGEAVRPGAHDLSAASTVFHALLLAGGPSALGTLRDVRVVRGDEVVARLDVYDYLLQGTRSGDIRLENDDTVFVPVRGPTVTVRGEITRPGVYEIRPDETLADVVRMAGGATGRTHLGRVRVDRILPPDRRTPGKGPRVTLDVSLADVLAGRETFTLEDLDDLHFVPIPDDRDDYVVVRGNVWFPSAYEYRAGMRVRDALTAAGGVRPDTFEGQAFLVRTRDDFTRETLTFDVPSVLAGESGADLELQPRDEITIWSRWDLEDRPTVSVGGAVRNPGEYELTTGMTVGQLLVRAGGFLEYAWPDEVEVSRVYPDDGDSFRIAETFRVPVGPDFLQRDRLPDFPLRNHDRIFVRRQPFWELQRDVRLAGQVLFPGTYTLESPTERLATLIDRAGGLRDTAYPEGFRMFRSQDDVGRISADLRRALEDRESDANLILVAGDSLYVPELPMTVKVSGAVNFPTSHVYRPGKGIGWYVDNSGGYRDDAKKGDTAIVYSTGRAGKVRRWWPDPGVEPGAEIVVPAELPGEGTDWGQVVTNVTAIAASLATTWLVVDTIIRQSE